MRKSTLQTNVTIELVPCPPEHLECYLAGISAWWARIEREKNRVSGLSSALSEKDSSRKKNLEVPKFTVFSSLSEADQNSAGAGSVNVSHNNSLCDVNDQDQGQNEVDPGQNRTNFVSHNRDISGGYVKNGAQKPIL